MKLKEALKQICQLFFLINTCIFIFLAIQAVTIVPDFTLDGWDMLSILFTSLASTLPVLIFVMKETAPRWEVLTRRALHFILTAGIVFGLQVYFGWINTTNAIILVIVFLVIYIVAYTIMEIQSKKLADQLNERLIAFHRAENETHRDEH